MKWFQVDSDTPNDPKIAAVIRQMGVGGFGALVLLWCHIADHGTVKPGWSINSRRQPMPEAELLEASRLTPEDFTKLITICVQSGHFLRKPWETRSVIAIPAMIARADTYTKRRVRTRVEPASTNVELCSSTVQDNTSTPIPPVVPLKGDRITRRDRQTAEQVRDRAWGGFCRHEPRCPTRGACINTIVRERKHTARVAS